MDNPLRFGAVCVVLGHRSGKYPDGNQILVQGSDTRVAFDTPIVTNTIGKDFDDVDLVILGHVHEDHMAGLHRVPHARVEVHEADLVAARSWEGMKAHYGYPEDVLADYRQVMERDFHWQPRPDAQPYAHGAQWDVGGGVRIRAHHLPGHTSGHCALVVESEGLAFIGDLDLTGFGPYYGDATSDLAQLRRSLKEVAQLDARTWVTSHHRAVITERALFERDLARFAAKVDERSDKLLAFLRDGPQSIEQLARRRVLYPPTYDAPFVHSVECRTVALHLEELMGQGRVRRDANLYQLA